MLKLAEAALRAIYDSLASTQGPYIRATDGVVMAMVNVTPRRLSITGLVVGAALLVVGVWLIWLDFELLLGFLKLFAGFFLVLFGLGILTASAARR